ncbi:MAG TPA: DoxX family protein [Blastocatellia bacterium]|nr:DoxX family protein [Blastocatellia bacterium]
MQRIGASKYSPRIIAGTVLIVLPMLALVFSSVLKFAGIPGVRDQMAALGFSGQKLMLIATIEVFSAFLFIWPRTRSIGLLLVSSYLGGAICAHLATSEFTKAINPFVLLMFAWVGTWLRHPQAMWSFASSVELDLADNDERNWASQR